MSLKVQQRAGHYLWSSSAPRMQPTLQQSYQPTSEPMTGLGIGCPLSRLFCRHFGGDMRILSIQVRSTLRLICDRSNKYSLFCLCVCLARAPVPTWLSTSVLGISLRTSRLDATPKFQCTYTGECGCIVILRLHSVYILRNTMPYHIGC